MTLLHRFTALLLLMAYAITGTSVVTATAAVLADLDGSHELMIQELGQNTQIVLHHRQGAATPKVADHPSASLRVLVCFCREDENGDHHFSAAHVTAKASTDGYESIKSPALPVQLNLAATQVLRLSFQWPVSQHARSCYNLRWKQKPLRGCASVVTDQLLI